MSYTLLLIWSSIAPGYKTLTLACKFTRRNKCRFKWSEHDTSASPNNRKRRPLFFFSLVVWLENFLVFSLVCRNLWQTAYTWQKEYHLFYSLYKMSWISISLNCILKSCLVSLNRVSCFLFSPSGACFLFTCEYESWSVWENEHTADALYQIHLFLDSWKNESIVVAL